jgi:hypothetical protein
MHSPKSSSCFETWVSEKCVQAAQRKCRTMYSVGRAALRQANAGRAAAARHSVS